MKRLTILMWREILTLTLWVLPLFLLPYGLGVWWIFRSGHGMTWIAVVAAGVLLVWGVGSLVRRRVSRREAREICVDSSAAEQSAREAIERVVKDWGQADLTNLKVAQEMLTTLWQRVSVAWYHQEMPHFRFTFAEALFLMEHSIRRFRLVLSAEIPAIQHVEFSDAQFLQQRVLPVSQSIGRVFRVGKWILRGAAPHTLLLQELSRFALKRGFSTLKGSARRRATELLIREAGESLILLFSRKLRGELLMPVPTENTERSSAPQAPLRILVAGQTNAGKSSVINALLGNIQASVDPLPRMKEPQVYLLEGQAAEDLALVELPGTGQALKKLWPEELQKADAVIWVVDAHRADRHLDQEAIHHYQTLFQTNPTWRPPALMVVLTHADLLEPAREWNPPYVPGGKKPKEQSMRQVFDVISTELGTREERMVLISCKDPLGAWNLDELWMKLVIQLPEAAKNQLERLGRKRSIPSALRAAARSVPGVIQAGTPGLTGRTNQPPPP